MTGILSIGWICNAAQQHPAALRAVGLALPLAHAFSTEVVFGSKFHKVGIRSMLRTLRNSDFIRKVVGRCNYLIDPTLRTVSLALKRLEDPLCLHRNKGLLAKLFLDAFEGP